MDNRSSIMTVNIADILTTSAKILNGARWVRDRIPLITSSRGKIAHRKPVFLLTPSKVKFSLLGIPRGSKES
eukprot:Gb_37192 [translate_table: standard]